MKKSKQEIIKDQESIGNIQITRDEYGSLNVEGEFMIWTKTGCLYFKPKPEDKRVFENESKLILDACCGSRMFWFDKENKNVIFGDNRELSDTLCDGRSLEIKPDINMDFRNMPFKDNVFKLVVFDPPHMKQLGNNSWMAKKYGVLNSTWQDDIKKGFSECFRVLDNNGILIFKWNEQQIRVSEILSLTEQKPLFGHKSGKLQKTHWLCFMKLEAIKEAERQGLWK